MRARVNVQTEPFRKVVDKSAADICARVTLSGEEAAAGFLSVLRELAAGASRSRQ